MKLKVGLLTVLLLAGTASLALPTPTNAQVSIGAHGTATEIRSRTAAGVGGRVAVLMRQSPDLTLALEGVAEYLWPSCDVADCGAVAFHANLLARRRVASYAEAYGGVGFLYQDFTVDAEGAKYKGDDFGMTLLVGTQAGSPGGIRPFLEVTFSIMNDVANQFGASLGLRIPVVR